jgi:transposase-like protein
MRDKRKEELVAEYLAGEMSYREMEDRYGVSASTLQRWVKASGSEAARRAKVARAAEAAGVKIEHELGSERAEEKDPAAEVKRLRGELRKAELHNKLLNAMIDIAEERFEIPIRKKHGARR